MDFEEIYRRYFGDVYRYLLRLSGSETAAEDVTSETFLRAMQALPRFRGDCDVRVWLCRIARNTYFSTRRDPDNQPMEEPGEERAGSVPSPEEETLRREEGRRLRQLLHDLEEPYREVFLWRHYGDLSFREIGQLFGKSENWACVTYHRARGKLRKEWEALP
ncbi:MAG: sigma-70 family RNA polymerase sigma factor [Dysosmobacter sp.]|nr:sigma-70 family RNA polymerase sigma factor [Dysosmobacter sp.]